MKVEIDDDAMSIVIPRSSWLGFVLISAVKLAQDPASLVMGLLVIFAAYIMWVLWTTPLALEMPSIPVRKRLADLLLTAPYHTLILPPEAVTIAGVDVDKIPFNAIPIIVVINPNSGGQKGQELMASLKTLLHPTQVIDILKEGEKFPRLRRMVSTLPRCCVLACGGDGTVASVLDFIHAYTQEKRKAIVTAKIEESVMKRSQVEQIVKFEKMREDYDTNADGEGEAISGIRGNGGEGGTVAVTSPMSPSSPSLLSSSSALQRSPTPSPTAAIRASPKRSSPAERADGGGGGSPHGGHAPSPMKLSSPLRNLMSSTLPSLPSLPSLPIPSISSLPSYVSSSLPSSMSSPLRRGIKTTGHESGVNGMQPSNSSSIMDEPVGELVGSSATDLHQRYHGIRLPPPTIPVRSYIVHALFCC